MRINELLRICLENYMSGFTNISDLPTNPSMGGNVSMNVSEIPPSDQQLDKKMSLDQATINQIISGLQTASVAGATQLPTRDIPMATEELAKDIQTQPNYIPVEQNNNYINQSESNQEIIREYNENVKKNNSLDELYDEMQIPLLLGVLYFIFQLPVVRKLLNSYIPMLFNVDGNMNINGYIFTSALFGGLYYALQKIMRIAR